MNLLTSTHIKAPLSLWRVQVLSAPPRCPAWLLELFEISDLVTFGAYLYLCTRVCMAAASRGGPQWGAEVHVWTTSGLYGGIMHCCAPSSHCPVGVSGKKSSYYSKEGATMDNSKSSGPHSTDMAIGNEDHWVLTSVSLCSEA